jgi:hypothetical protein
MAQKGVRPVGLLKEDYELLIRYCGKIQMETGKKAPVVAVLGKLIRDAVNKDE